MLPKWRLLNLYNFKKQTVQLKLHSFCIFKGYSFTIYLVDKMKKFLLSLMILIILFVSSCMKPSKPIDDNNQNNQNIISETIILDKKLKLHIQRQINKR